MPLVITFNTFAEKKPANDELIIVLKPTYSFGYQGFDPISCSADYCWFGLDEDGNEDGSQYTYDESEDPPENCILRILIDGYIADDDWYWISEKDYWNCFPTD